MARIIGFTLCKNINKYNFPIELNIEQHSDLVDVHWFIVPKPHQDIDGTRKTIQEYIDEHEIDGRFFEVDWPTQKSFYTESIDKILQQQFIDFIEPLIEYDDWLIKLDADEFLHEMDFDVIKDRIEQCEESDINRIGFNYRQFVGSVEYEIKDPTTSTYHLFRPNCHAKFPGNDAMNILTDGDSIFLEDIYVSHIGYVKSESDLSIKIREHIVLNSSVYDGSIDRSLIPLYYFTFPKHVKGTYIWPLGIAELRGEKNEAEYFKVDENLIPGVLLNNKEKMRFFVPEGV